MNKAGVINSQSHEGRLSPGARVASEGDQVASGSGKGSEVGNSGYQKDQIKEVTRRNGNQKNENEKMISSRSCLDENAGNSDCRPDSSNQKNDQKNENEKMTSSRSCPGEKAGNSGCRPDLVEEKEQVEQGAQGQAKAASSLEDNPGKLKSRPVRMNLCEDALRKESCLGGRS